MVNNELFLEIEVKPTNLFLKIVLFTVAIIPILIILSILILSKKIESPFGFFIGIIILGSISFILFRTLLWNTYGKEVYIFKQGEVTMFNDFKIFKDNRRVVKISSKVEVYYSNLEKQHDFFELTEENLKTTKPNIEYVVTFLINEEEHTSVVKLNLNSLKELAQQVNPIIKRF